MNAPSLATRLGVGQVLVKDESRRLGLPSFKILGASWAVYRAIRDGLGLALRPWQTVDDLRAQLSPLGGMVLVTATDGNHGRAVARVVSGESGAAGLGGLLALVDGRAAPELRAIVGLNGSARVLLLSTEGATDALAYEQIVGRSPASVVAQTA